MRKLSLVPLAALLTAIHMSADPPTAATVQVVKYDGLSALIKQQRGKVVVVDFWADFCIPCKREFPKLVALNNLETGNICFGGAHGVPSPDAPKMAQLSSAVRSEIASTLAAAQSVVQQSPPDVTEFKRAETSR